jgi:hypothetical protein
MTIHKTAKGFGDSLRKRAQETVRAAAIAEQKQVARALWEKILSRTPVASGHAVANWRASLNEPDGTVTSSTDTTLRWGDLEAVLTQLDSAPLGSVVYISNGVHYIGILEHGHSTQSPEGFFQLAIEEVLNG